MSEEFIDLRTTEMKVDDCLKKVEALEAHTKYGTIEQVLENIEKMKKIWDENIESFLKQVADKLDARDEQIRALQTELADMKQAHDTWWLDLASIVRDEHPKLAEDIKNLYANETRDLDQMLNIEAVLRESIDLQYHHYTMGQLFGDAHKYEGLLEKLDSGGSKSDDRETSNNMVGRMKVSDTEEKLPEPIYLSLKLEKEIDVCGLIEHLRYIISNENDITHPSDYNQDHLKKIYKWKDVAKILLRADKSWYERKELYHKYDVIKHKAEPEKRDAT